MIRTSLTHKTDWLTHLPDSASRRLWLLLEDDSKLGSIKLALRLKYQMITEQSWCSTWIVSPLIAFCTAEFGFLHERVEMKQGKRWGMDMVVVGMKQWYELDFFTCLCYCCRHLLSNTWYAEWARIQETEKLQGLHAYTGWGGEPATFLSLTQSTPSWWYVSFSSPR